MEKRKERLFEVVETSKLYTLTFVVSLFSRGWSGDWFAPSLVEVEACGLLPLVRDGVWFVSLKCEVDWLLFGYGPTPRLWGGVWEWSSVLPVVVQILLGGGSLGGSPRWSGLEILLGEGGDVELGARTSKHILLFAFDPLVSLTLSLFYLCKASYFIHIIYCLLCLA